MRAVVAPRAAQGLCASRRLPALIAAIVLSAALAACGGGGSTSAQSLLNQTFKSHAPIESGRIQLSVSFSSVGAIRALPVKGPLSLRLEGPFQSIAAGQLPHFALQAELQSGGLLTAPGHTLRVGATSIDGQLFIELGGTPFRAPATTVQALQQGYTQASRAASSAASSSTFATLGVDPGEWLTNPTVVGSSDVSGAGTVHIVAGLNTARFLADAGKLAGAGGSLGLGAAGQGTGSFAAGEVSALERSVRSARVDVYIGASDHLLRALSLRVEVLTTPAARAALGGLRSGTLTLSLQFAELNQPQTIAPPSNPQSISQLLPVLERLGLVGGPARGG